MSKDGKPAEYQQCEYSFETKMVFACFDQRIKDGDYTMIYGYPGSTNRYETSYGVK